MLYGYQQKKTTYRRYHRWEPDETNLRRFPCRSNAALLCRVRAGTRFRAGGGRGGRHARRLGLLF